VDTFANLVDNRSFLANGGDRIQAIDIHLDKERRQLLEKAFIHKYIHGDLNCRT
jgi:hypothetical protein